MGVVRRNDALIAELGDNDNEFRDGPLIAAAPDMLDALREFRDALENEKDIHSSRLDAVIAKAEGK